MNRKPSCQSFALTEILLDHADPQTQLAFESHVESCDQCQQQLSELAAEPELWTQASGHLSTATELELSPAIANRLSSSSAFVMPEISPTSAPISAPADQQRVHSGAQAHSLLPSAEASHEWLGAGEHWTRLLDPPSHPEMLGRIDQFEIESKIGQGGMGVVLKGFDRELNRAVAIKVLAPHLAAHGTARKRFAREALAAAAVMHPNVVPIYSVNKSPARPYIVMQLAPGMSLQSLVQANGPLPPTEVVRISAQIAAGLAAAHQKGLIHRDVKPGNILTERDVSRVMITDFGLARAADDAGMTQTGWLAGTPHYMSPEQSKGEELDHRSDLFSLGSLMYFLATGREPFRGDKPYAVIQKIISRPATSARSINPEIPGMLGEIIEKLHEKEPRDRFQTAAEVQSLLEQYLAHLQHPQHAQPPKRILTSRRKRRRQGLLLGGGAITVGIALTFLQSWVPWGRGDDLAGDPISARPSVQAVADPDKKRDGAVVTPKQPMAPTFEPTPEDRFNAGVSAGLSAGGSADSQFPIEPMSGRFQFTESEFVDEFRAIKAELERLETSLRLAPQ